MFRTDRCLSCRECTRATYKGGGVICCGIATQPEPTFDVIRLCTKKPGESIFTIQEWAPDEALVLMECVANASRKYLLSAPPYRRFRMLDDQEFVEEA
jgi:hypothetical protein